MHKKTSTMIAALMLGFFIGAAAPVQAEKAESQVSSPALKGQQVQDQRFLREEEKLARDVYLTLHKRWNLQIFSNIAQAEQRHMDRMESLLKTNGIADPVQDDAIGAFTNKELAKLYTDLVAQGSRSEIDALTVGATIEDLDLRDIQVMQTNTNAAEAQQVFDALACGSRNHMRAFHSQLESRGASYQAQYLTSTSLEQILTGSHERCGQSAKFKSKRQGKGNRPGHMRGQNNQGNGPGKGHNCQHRGR